MGITGLYVLTCSAVVRALIVAASKWLLASSSRSKLQGTSANAANATLAFSPPLKSPAAVSQQLQFLYKERLQHMTTASVCAQAISGCRLWSLSCVFPARLQHSCLCNKLGEKMSHTVRHYCPQLSVQSVCTKCRSQ